MALLFSPTEQEASRPKTKQMLFFYYCEMPKTVDLSYDESYEKYAYSKLSVLFMANENNIAHAAWDSNSTDVEDTNPLRR
jgi:hypothetical protein